MSSELKDVEELQTLADLQVFVEERIVPSQVRLGKNNPHVHKSRVRMGIIQDEILNSVIESPVRQQELLREYLHLLLDVNSDENISSYFQGMYDCFGLLEYLGWIDKDLCGGKDPELMVRCLRKIFDMIETKES